MLSFSIVGGKARSQDGSMGVACPVHMALQEMYYGAKKPPFDLSRDGFGILVAPLSGLISNSGDVNV